MLDFRKRVVWIPVINASGETIPGGALMEPFADPPTHNGQDEDGNWYVRKPTSDGNTRVIVNGEAEIPDGGTGQGHRDTMAVLLYDTTEDLPLSGDQYGSKAGSWQAHKDFAGFRIDHAGNGRANAQRESGGGSLVGKLVKCVSATAAAGSGVGAECYSATIKNPTATGQLTSFASGSNVWLTLGGVNAPAVPELNRYYLVVAVLGEVEAATGDTRQRVVGQEASAPPSVPVVYAAVVRVTGSLVSPGGGAVDYYPGKIDTLDGTPAWDEQTDVRIVNLGTTALSGRYPGAYAGTFDDLPYYAVRDNTKYCSGGFLIEDTE